MLKKRSALQQIILGMRYCKLMWPAVGTVKNRMNPGMSMKLKSLYWDFFMAIENAQHAECEKYRFKEEKISDEYQQIMSGVHEGFGRGMDSQDTGRRRERVAKDNAE